MTDKSTDEETVRIPGWQTFISQDDPIHPFPSNELKIRINPEPVCFSSHINRGRSHDFIGQFRVPWYIPWPFRNLYRRRQQRERDRHFIGCLDRAKDRAEGGGPISYQPYREPRIGADQ